MADSFCAECADWMACERAVLAFLHLVRVVAFGVWCGSGKGFRFDIEHETGKGLFRMEAQSEKERLWGG